MDPAVYIALPTPINIALTKIKPDEYIISCDIWNKKITGYIRQYGRRWGGLRIDDTTRVTQLFGDHEMILNKLASSLY